MGLRDLLILSACMAPGFLPAADASSPSVAGTGSTESVKADELDEIVVQGRRAAEQARRPSFRDLQYPFDFLSHLVGTFVIDGRVTLHRPDMDEVVRKVSGRAECVGFGVAPGVLCELRVRWPAAAGPDGREIPGGVTNLDPAMMLLGYEPVDNGFGAELSRMLWRNETPPYLPEDRKEHPGIYHTIIDSTGFAESARGRMDAPDIMRSRGTCTTIADECERAVAISVQPGQHVVEMKMDLNIDGETAASFLFVMHRVPGMPSVVFGRQPGKREK